MKIVPIKNLSIFDISRSGQKTYFSMDVDGVAVYSKAVLGFPDLNSGVKTVGAFQNEQKETLFAWIDPLSREFIFTTSEGTFRPSTMLPIVISLAISLIIRIADILPDYTLSIFLVLMLLGALVTTVLKRVADRKVEVILRSHLKNNS